MNAPLQDLRVIDFTRVLAGPHCTKILRDLGADVTKIEPPAGDAGRAGVPHINNMSVYYTQQNAGKRNISIDLNYPEAREIVRDLCRDADVIVENFRPGTLARFGLGYEQVREFNPNIVYVSISGYGQVGPWRNRPAFAPTVQAETGLTDILEHHYGEALSELRNDACSHADLYTGLQGVIAVLAALAHRNRTGEGQYVDVSMAATMLSVNERAGAQLSGIDTKGEPVALSAPESHIFDLPDGRRVTIAASPIYTPMFVRYCAMMRRTDLLTDPRFASAPLRRAEPQGSAGGGARLDFDLRRSRRAAGPGERRRPGDRCHSEHAGAGRVRMGQGLGGCRGGQRSRWRHRADARTALAVQPFHFAVAGPACLSGRAQCRAACRAEREPGRDRRPAAAPRAAEPATAWRV